MPELTDQAVWLHAQEGLTEPLPLHAEGYKCTTDDWWRVLLGVAANRGTLESVCADLVGTPDPHTSRGSLHEPLCVDEVPALEQQRNAALAAEVPGRVRPQAQDVAIDSQDRPYYGKGEQAPELWGRGKATEGTPRCYRIATAYVIRTGLRVTRALHCVVPADDVVRVLARWLRRVQEQGLEVGCRLLDKGVDGIAGMEDLTRQGYPALIACTVRGTQGGTRALCRGHQSYRTTPTFTGPHHTEFPAAVLVWRAFTTARRTGRHRRQATGLLVSQIPLTLSPRYARQLYRSRFGLETRYRCAGRVRGWTTAKNPAYRFGLSALAFVLLNVGSHLRGIFTQVPRQGGRWLAVKRFRLTRFAKVIQQALEEWYGCVRTITAPALSRC